MGKATIRSVAAVLLVVAVLAGSCASGVDAQFTITNTCTRTITVATATSSVTIPPGGSVPVPPPSTAFFVSPVTVTLSGGTPPPVTIVVPGFVVVILRAFGSLLQKLTVACVGNCILLFPTIQFPTFPPFPSFPPFTLQYGPFCA